MGVGETLGKGREGEKGECGMALTEAAACRERHASAGSGHADATGRFELWGVFA
jgi:hypothetical protein